jgi:hypothetical protein
MLEHCKPDIIVERMELLDQDDLWRRGIRGVILDLDNTLCFWGSSEVSPERRAWVERAKTRFKLCILSNTIKSRRLKRVGEMLDLPTVGRWGLGRKPFRGGIRAALKRTGTAPAETVIVGDQVFADVLGGNLNGLLTVWVPLLAPREFFTTRLIRGLERRVLRRLGCEIPAGKCG